MPCRHSDADRSAGVTGGRLDPQALVRPFPQDAPVPDTVQRHTAGQAEVFRAGFVVNRAGEAEHHLFGNLLDGPRQVHFSLCQ
jgi:hypothetical protein